MSAMRLRVLLPNEILLDTGVSKITAESPIGSFCLEPRHADYVSALVPGILIYVLEDGGARFFAIDTGTLVKVADEVLVSTRKAIPGESFEALRHAVEHDLLALGDRERAARTALARLEAGVIRRLREFERARP